MNTRFIWIFVALFALGCGDDATDGQGGQGGDGTGGAGGTGGAEPVPVEGACTTEANLALYAGYTHTGTDDMIREGLGAVTRLAEECALPGCSEEVGDVVVDASEQNVNALVTCIIDCVQLEVDLSDDCLSCYAGVVVCAVNDCLVECAEDTSSEACVDCRAENCDPAFTECAGTPMLFLDQM